MEKNKNKRKHDDALKMYFSQIKKSPLLNFEQERELSRRILKGDAQAKEKLVEANLRLVVKIAKAYMNEDVAFLDLIQEGNIGLLKAAGKYDYKKNVRFSTYASWWIKQSISRALSNKRRSIRLPHRKEETLRKIQKAFSALNQQEMRKPSIEEIAEYIGMDKDDVLEIMNVSFNPVSLDTEINEDAGTLHDIFEDFSYSPDNEFMEKSMQEETIHFLHHLMDRERKILSYRYALEGGKKYTLKRISDEMGISPETVRQIEMRALRKLKKHAGEIKEYIYS
jgi:RNA polymerase primary sigma factor